MERKVRRHSQSNIMLVVADQLTAFATSPYGNPDVITPYLGQLAQRGTTFLNAYCNAPLCWPSRASLLTGQLPSRLPVYDNAQELSASVPTFVHHLRRGGYRTILSGKMHFIGPDQLHGFEERLTTEIYPSDYYWTWSWLRLREEVRRASAVPSDDTHSEPLASPTRDPINTPLPYGLAFNHDETGMAETVLNAGVTPWTMYFAHDEEVHFRALEKLRHLATGEDGRPWFMCVSYIQPHQPFLTTAEYWDRYAGRTIRPPEEAPEGSGAHVSDMWPNVFHGVDRIRPSVEDVIRARRAYYANVTYIDDKLGSLLHELERLGLAENTVVIFTSDHGEMLGEHGMWFKRTCREWSARVPLVVAGTGIVHRTVTDNVSLLDLCPTLIELAGLQLPKSYGEFAAKPEGRDLTPFLRGPRPRDWVDEIVIEYNGDGVCQPIRAIVRGRLKFVAVHTEADQLYDLEADPQEWHNLATGEEMRDIAESLRTRVLQDWDPTQLAEDVIASQRLRIFLNEALYRGQYHAWDYEPRSDASRVWVRPVLSQPFEHLVYERILLNYKEQVGLLSDSASIRPDSETSDGRTG